MNRQSWFEKWKASDKSLVGPAACGVAVIFVAVGWFLHSSGDVRKGVATYRAAFDSVQAKATEIQHALEENQRLHYENDNLRLKLESARFDCREKAASSETAEVGGVARTIASISYQIPDNLLPGQLYTLGVTYFKAHENEKAAVIFSRLTSMQDNLAFQNSRDFLMTGVAWYRLQNYELANQYFDKILSLPEADSNLQYQAQARLWKGLVAKEQGDAKTTQHWLRDLVDHHPHSMEASWVNSTEAERVPASAK